MGVGSKDYLLPVLCWVSRDVGNFGNAKKSRNFAEIFSSVPPRSPKIPYPISKSADWIFRSATGLVEQNTLEVATRRHVLPSHETNAMKSSLARSPGRAKCAAVRSVTGRRHATVRSEGCRRPGTPRTRGFSPVLAKAVAEPETASAGEAEEKEARPVYPLTAIVGQEEMKLALCLNVIDPKIGGVMIMGDRGTGKSTTVRALADILPEIEIVENDPFNSSPDDRELMGPEATEKFNAGESLPKTYMRVPMIDLPLGATEDRVCGSIDIERALTGGVKAFEPGLLAKANRGLLYVDEVNLLDDHLVDVLLDSAASGWNTVEREGISISHPARFILVGSGNPEEGELRPQLLDRFGMMAEIRTEREPERRVLIVEERQRFDSDPSTFRASYKDSQAAIKDRLQEARDRLKDVSVERDLRVQISQLCSTLDVDGLRGDLVTNRAAKALCAFEGRTEVTVEDIGRVAVLCLRHRLRKDPLATVDDGDKVKEVFDEIFGVED